jgi:DNA repair protein RadC
MSPNAYGPPDALVLSAVGLIIAIGTRMNNYILNSQMAYYEFSKYLKNDVEELWVCTLSSSKEIITTSRIFKGTVDQCICHPRDIFRFACQQNASNIILAHNHPSNCSKPSTEDIVLTKKLIKCGRLMQIPVIDHLILTDRSYSSFADMGYIK